MPIMLLVESAQDAAAMGGQLDSACPNCTVHTVVLSDGLPWPKPGGGNPPVTVKAIRAGVAALREATPGVAPVVVIR